MVWFDFDWDIFIISVGSKSLTLSIFSGDVLRSIWISDWVVFLVGLSVSGLQEVYSKDVSDLPTIARFYNVIAFGCDETASRGLLVTMQFLGKKQNV